MKRLFTFALLASFIICPITEVAGAAASLPAPTGSLFHAAIPSSSLVGSGVAISSSGAIYTVNSQAGTIIKYDGQNTSIVASELGYSMSIAIDKSDNIFVGKMNGSVLKFSPGTLSPTTIATGIYGQPRALAADDFGNLYITNTLQNQIIKVTPSGYVSVAMTTSGPACGVAVDSAGNIFAALCQFGAQEMLTNGTKIDLQYGFSDVRAVTVDRFNDAYFYDAGSHRLIELTPSGTFTQLFTDGNITIASTYTAGLIVDNSSIILVQGDSAVSIWTSSPNSTGYAPGAVRVSWGKPLGSPLVDRYEVSAKNQTSPGRGEGYCTGYDPSDSCVVTDLIGGNLYTFQIVAVSGDLRSSAAVTQTPVLAPATAPGAPTNVRVTSLFSNEATVSWDPPTENGGSGITAFTVTSFPEGNTCATSGATTCIVRNLSNGTSYTFSVAASNSAGTGYSSDASAAFTPQASAPSTPTNLAATAGVGASTLTWSPPISDGGSDIDGYIVEISSDNVNWSATSFSGLSTSYKVSLCAACSAYVRVGARNSVGQSEFSAPFVVHSGGLTSRSVTISTSDGQPITGGVVTWFGDGVRSSVSYGLNSSGLVVFPLAPAGPVTIRITRGTLPDGSTVSGSFSEVFGLGPLQLSIPELPSSVSSVISVQTPLGTPISGANVSVYGLISTVNVGTFRFFSPSGNTEGVTDENGLFTGIGFNSPGATARVSYNDGIVTQFQNVNVDGPLTTVKLKFEPTIASNVTSIIASSGSMVSVDLDLLTQSELPQFRSFSPRVVKAGVTISAVLPKGYKMGSCGAKYSALTDSAGHAKVYICATASSAISFKAKGVYSSKPIHIYVLGGRPEKVQHLSASSPKLQTVNISWMKPTFDGGSAITGYLITATAPGHKTVSVLTPTTTASLNGLSSATAYKISVIAKNRNGVSLPSEILVGVS